MKGFIMQDKIKETAADRLRLSTVLSDNAEALYEALTQHATGCVCHMVAVELLKMARWDMEEFIGAYEMFDLDG
jgi:hypothetical protein